MLNLIDRYRWLLWAALAVPFLIGAGMLLERRLSGPQPLELQVGGNPALAIKVYVAGAVANPGVYTLQQGSRIADALAAAGGPTADADLLRINLAQRVRDEDQIIVPRVGEALPASASGEAAKININTASAELLDTLPGIGAVRSRNIVESRERDGPFQRTEELVERKLIPQSVYEQIEDLISVGP